MIIWFLVAVVFFLILRWLIKDTANGVKEDFENGQGWMYFVSLPVCFIVTAATDSFAQGLAVTAITIFTIAAFQMDSYLTMIVLPMSYYYFNQVDHTNAIGSAIIACAIAVFAFFIDLFIADYMMLRSESKSTVSSTDKKETMSNKDNFFCDDPSKW